MSNVLNVTSEIGKLKQVMLHRPGQELENLTPDLLERLLFDDIPYLKIAQEEHDAFSKILTDHNIDVLYIEKLIAETLDSSKEVKDNFIKDFIKEAAIESPSMQEKLSEYLYSLSTQDMVNNMIAGIRTNVIKGYSKDTLADYIIGDYPFITDPMPNLLFSRDNFAIIGNGVTLNKMMSVTRNRESLIGEYIFNYHPTFKGVPQWYKRSYPNHMEGGDELILSSKALAIGISQRTTPAAIDQLAHNLLNSDASFEKILAFDIPESRAFMHLDTVFTHVDYDKFTIHPGIQGPLTVYKLSKKGSDIKIEVLNDILEKTLEKEVVGAPVTLLPCGGGDPIDSGREQWNDGSNTLAIAPGEVVVYSRNHVSNELLDKAGIKLNIMPSSELSRGRGGPRCMSMPFVRENL